MSKNWYHLNNVSELDSPALVIYKDRVKENIKTLVESIDDITRLRPHIKTHKSSEVSSMLLDSGIAKFKCATISEAEMLASTGAKDILLAYQPVGPKGKRFLSLVTHFSGVLFSCLIDNIETARELSGVFAKENKVCRVCIDLNVGMNRTGIKPEDAFHLWTETRSLPGIKIVGLHAYDGHIRDVDFNKRKERSDDAFNEVFKQAEKINNLSAEKIFIVAGGTPTYSIHSQRKNVECSPGTFIYWDKGYEQILTEQHYLHAAVVVTRIVSKPEKGIICIDLGHKAIASENPLAQRVFFLNGKDLIPIGHSEEHMVLQTAHDDEFKIGDVLYGIPFHVCPTIALYDRTAVAENGSITDFWFTASRNRIISI
jgi:D-threonine aldolase